MDQTLCLRHANFKVHWTLTEASARTVRRGRERAPRVLRPYQLPAHTRRRRHPFRVRERVQGAGGLLGKAASRVVVGGVPEREANVHYNNSKRSWNTDRQSAMRHFPLRGLPFVTHSLSAPESHSDGRLSRREAQRDPGAPEGAQAARRRVPVAPGGGRRRSAASATARPRRRPPRPRAAAPARRRPSAPAAAAAAARAAAAPARPRRCSSCAIVPASPSPSSPRRWGSSRTTSTA